MHLLNRVLVSAEVSGLLGFHLFWAISRIWVGAIIVSTASYRGQLRQPSGYWPWHSMQAPCIDSQQLCMNMVCVFNFNYSWGRYLVQYGLSSEMSGPGRTLEWDRQPRKLTKAGPGKAFHTRGSACVCLRETVFNSACPSSVVVSSKQIACKRACPSCVS
jgi:hypothetical protein